MNYKRNYFQYKTIDTSSFEMNIDLHTLGNYSYLSIPLFNSIGDAKVDVSYVLPFNQNASNSNLLGLNLFFYIKKINESGHDNLYLVNKAIEQIELIKVTSDQYSDLKDTLNNLFIRCVYRRFDDSEQLNKRYYVFVDDNKTKYYFDAENLQNGLNYVKYIETKDGIILKVRAYLFDLQTICFSIMTYDGPDNDLVWKQSHAIYCLNVYYNYLNYLITKIEYFKKLNSQIVTTFCEFNVLFDTSNNNYTFVKKTLVDHDSTAQYIIDGYRYDTYVASFSNSTKFVYGYIGNNTLYENLNESIVFETATPVKTLSYSDKKLGILKNFHFVLNLYNYLNIEDVTDSTHVLREGYIFDTDNSIHFPVIINKFTSYDTNVFFKYDSNSLLLTRKSEEICNTKTLGQIKSLLLNSYFEENLNNWNFLSTYGVQILNDIDLSDNYNFICNFDENLYGKSLLINGFNYFYQEQEIKNMPGEPISIIFYGGYTNCSSTSNSAITLSLDIYYLDQTTETIQKTIYKSELGDGFFKFYVYSLSRSKQILSVRVRIYISSNYTCVFKGLSLRRGSAITSYTYEKGLLIKETCNGETTNYRYDSQFRMVDFSGASELKTKKDYDSESDFYKDVNSTNINGIHSEKHYVDLYNVSDYFKNYKENNVTSKLLDGTKVDSDLLINNIESNEYSTQNYKLINKINFNGVEEIYGYNFLENKSSTETNYYSSLDSALNHDTSEIIFTKLDSYSYDNFGNIEKYEFVIQNYSYSSNEISFVEFTDLTHSIKRNGNTIYRDLYFSYNNMNQLTSIYSGSYTLLTVSYTENGNILSKNINENVFNYSYSFGNLSGLTISKDNAQIYNIVYSYDYSNLFISNYELTFSNSSANYTYIYSLNYQNKSRTVEILEDFNSDIELTSLLCADPFNNTQVITYSLDESNYCDIHYQSEKTEFYDQNLDKLQDYLLTNGYNFTTFFESSYFTNGVEYDNQARFNIFSLGANPTGNFIDRDASLDIACTFADANVTFIDGKPCAKYSSIYYDRGEYNFKYSFSFQFRNSQQVLFEIYKNLNTCLFLLAKDGTTNYYKFALSYGGHTTQYKTNISINENGWNLFYFEYSRVDHVINILINGQIIYQYSDFTPTEINSFLTYLETRYFHFYTNSGYAFIRNILYTHNKFLSEDVKTNFLNYSLKDITEDRFVEDNGKKHFSYKLDVFKSINHGESIDFISIPLKNSILTDKGAEPKYFEREKSSFLDSVYPNQFLLNESNIPMYNCSGKLLAYSFKSLDENTIFFKFKLNSTSSTNRTLFSIGDLNHEFVKVYLVSNTLKVNVNGTNDFSGWTITSNSTLTIGFTYKIVQVGTSITLNYLLKLGSNYIQRTVNLSALPYRTTLFLGRSTATPTENINNSQPLFGLIGSVEIFDSFFSLSNLQNHIDTIGETCLTNKYDVFDKLSVRTITKMNNNVVVKYSYNYESSDNLHYIFDKISSEEINYGTSNNLNSYEYDKRGNLISFNNISYSYNDLNEILRDGDGHEIFTYDHNGNILTRKMNNVGYIYTYSRLYGIKNVLTKISQRNSTSNYVNISYSPSKPGYPTEISYQYNNLVLRKISLEYCGTRVEKYQSNSNITKYAYNNDGVRWLKISNSGNCYQKFENDRLIYEKAANGYEFFYHYDSENCPIGFSFKNNSTVLEYFYVVNALGIIEKIVDSSGNVVVSYEYGIYGNVVSAVDTSGCNFKSYSSLRYKSYCYDNESGWYYLISRYYVPEWGRFLTPDSVENLKAENVSSLNLYTYCRNNPLIYSDNSGRFVISIILTLGLLTLASTLIYVWSSYKSYNENKAAYIAKIVVKFFVNWALSICYLYVPFFVASPISTIVNSFIDVIFDAVSGTKIDWTDVGIEILVETCISVMVSGTLDYMFSNHTGQSEYRQIRSKMKAKDFYKLGLIPSFCDNFEDFIQGVFEEVFSTMLSCFTETTINACVYKKGSSL